MNDKFDELTKSLAPGPLPILWESVTERCMRNLGPIALAAALWRKAKLNAMA